MCQLAGGMLVYFGTGGSAESLVEQTAAAERTEKAEIGTLRTLQHMPNISKH